MYGILPDICCIFRGQSLQKDGIHSAWSIYIIHQIMVSNVRPDGSWVLQRPSHYSADGSKLDIKGMITNPSKDIKSCELFKIRKKPKRYENNKISCGNTQHNSELLTQLTPIFWRGQEPSFKEIAEGVLPSSSDESGWPQLNVKYFWIITKKTAK